jgi:hypothetical protein
VSKEQLADYLKTLKDQPLFTQEEENILLKSINMLNNDASMWQLMGMRCALKQILLNKIDPSRDTKCTCGELKLSFNEWLKGVDSTIRTNLNHLVTEEAKLLRKKISTCVQITALTGAGFLLTYGIALAIHDMNEKG